MGLLDKNDSAPYLIDDKTISEFDKDKDGRMFIEEYLELIESNEKLIIPAIEIIKAQFGITIEAIKAKVEEDRQTKTTDI